MFSRRPLAIVDVETTGLDPEVHDIIEIGAILVDQLSLAEISRFDTKVQPWFIQEPSRRALIVNGYRKEDWIDAQTLHQMMRHFAGLSDGAVLAAWNITFEYTFLREAFRRTGFTNTSDYHRVDIPSIAWSKLRPTDKIS